MMGKVKGKGKGNPYQLSRDRNPSYIPKWMQEKYGQMVKDNIQPEISDSSVVATIIPLWNSQQHINKLLSGLFGQTHRGRAYLIGSREDKTWQGIDTKYRDGLDLLAEPLHFDADFLGIPVSANVWVGEWLTIVEIDVPADWEGRNTNLKRNAGGVVAAIFGAEFLFYTDAKIARDEEWHADGLHLMKKHDVFAVAGVMEGTDESRETFWGRFADDALVRRNPRFGDGYILTDKNFGNGESLPITATFAMSVVEFVHMGGFDIRFTVSYEDYSGAWRLVLNGGKILCTGKWVVWHKHRQGLSNVRLEYIRSGGGAAMLYYLYPECPFAQRRVRQVLIVVTGIFVAFLSLLMPLIFGQLEMLAGFAIMGTALYGIAGVFNVAKADYAKAFVFPMLTGIFMVSFTYGFMIQLMRRGGGAQILQTMWTSWASV